MSTFSDVSAYTNPFGTPSKGTWNLTPAIWIDKTTGTAVQFFAESRSGDPKGLLTAIDQISDSGSRRLAVYKYPYLDGQRIKDLGRNGETYSFNIKFIGPDYQSKYKEFYQNVYLSKNAGKLIHPVLMAIRGSIDTRLQTFEPVHRADEWNSITFRAVFIEDNTAAIDFAANADPAPSTETALQKSLSDLVRLQANVSTLLAGVTAVLQIPAAVVAATKQRLNSIIGQISGLIGQMAATFSSASDLLSVLSVASGATGGVGDISSGSIVTQTTTGASQVTTIPPVFQVGLDASTQSLVEANISSFVSANQVTTQQAVFSANQARAAITAAIADIEANLGNYGYDIVVQYRTMAVSLQATVEACITAAQSKVKLYTVPRAMSLRMIAFANGLDPDRQNDIENLNPYLPSVNYIPAGSVVTVPAA